MTGLTPGERADSELVAAWQGGDELAASALVGRHASALARFIESRGFEAADRDDILQDVFFRAFRGIGGWRQEGNFRGWLFRIAVNAVRDRYRSAGGRVVVPLDEEELVDKADPAAEFAASELLDRVKGGLRVLSPMQREVFLLRAEQGLEYAEIAVLVGSTAGAARVHYHHAVRRLRERIAG